MNTQIEVYSTDPKWLGNSEYEEAIILADVFLTTEGHGEDMYGTFEYEAIYVDDHEVSYDVLSPEDKKKLDDVAQVYADENAWENYEDQQRSRRENSWEGDR